MDYNDEVRPPRGWFLTGWLLSAVPSLLLLSGSVRAWIGSAQVVAGMTKLGYAPAFLHILSPIEFLCVALYLVPRTAVLGAILLTAYFGGAVASHARIGDPQWVVPAAFGILVWAGLLLRRAELRRFLM